MESGPILMQRERISEMLATIPHFDGSSCLGSRQANGLDLPVFAINLNHRTDRWNALTHRFRAVGVDRIVRAPAVEGAKITDETLSLLLGDAATGVNALPESHLSLTRPAVGCFLSHLSVWKWVAESGLPLVMVMEDDANPTSDFDASQFARALQSQPDNGILFPGCIVMGGLAETRQQNGLVRVYYFNGTFAYVVSAQTCAYLLRHMLPMRMHVDHQLSHLLLERRHNFTGLLMKTGMIQPDWSLGSDINVGLRDEAEADREQHRFLGNHRNTLEAEGCALRPNDSPL
jgi:GR25 family glycosyltransferase involved in LPS biosynthesis